MFIYSIRAVRPCLAPLGHLAEIALHEFLTKPSQSFDRASSKLRALSITASVTPSMPRLRRLAIFLMLALLWTTPGAQADEAGAERPVQWAQPVGTQYNLHQMTPTLYRSALPDAKAVALLQSLQIGTVVNFLPESDDTWLPPGNITRVQQPYRTNHVDDADIIAALRAIRAAEAEGPVLMHCKHGSDRTGLIAAMYRVVIQGWSKDEAISEMTQGGFGENDHFKDSIRYMMHADVDKLREALASGACSTSPYATCALKSWLKSAGA